MSRWARRACIVLLAVAWIVPVFAYEVHGKIGEKWQSLGGANGFLGAPLTDETAAPDGIGRYNHFQGGTIYWTPATGAHVVYGAIRDKWAALEWERGALGYPISDEADVADGRGRYGNFQAGTIFWSSATGAWAVRGQILRKWVELRGARGFLGYPLSDLTVAPDGRGQYVHFEGGSLYWSPESGAHEVHGAIRDKWAALSWERGALGYPTSDEYADGGYRVSRFQHGSIRWSAAGGAVASVTLVGDVALNPVPD